MAEATITEISKEDLPVNLISGTAEKRRARVFVRCTSAAGSDTITLGNYLGPSILSDIEGVYYATQNNAFPGTTVPITWDGGTATLAAHAGSGLWEIGFIVNFV